MKKLILTVAILASGVSAFAFTNNNIVPSETITIMVNDDFKEVAADKLPAAVTNAVTKDFATATIGKAYVNSSEQYKIELNIDGSKSTVYVDKDGKWLKDTDIISTVKEEGDASTVIEEGDASTVKEEVKASTVIEEGDANTVKEEGDAKM